MSTKSAGVHTESGVDRMRARMQAFRSVVLLVWPFMSEIYVILRTYGKSEEYGIFRTRFPRTPATMKAMLAGAFGPGYQQAGDAPAFPLCQNCVRTPSVRSVEFAV